MKKGSLVRMLPDAVKNNINLGGYGSYIKKIGIVINARENNNYKVIKVKFPCSEHPEEWLASDFEAVED
jgi:hypothetical protein